MIRNLPSLIALRGFEAAARHLNFTEAAKELEVTQTAVSHQIKSLEHQLGLKLFNRIGKSVSLTEAAKTLLPAASKSFDTLQTAVNEITEEGPAQVLTISVTPDFATGWLIQRLSRFWRNNPDVQLNIHHSIEPATFYNDGVDIAIRIGDGNWPELEVRYLMPLILYPICHRSLLSGNHPLSSVSDLKHQTLLHNNSYEDWTIWLRSAGIRDIDSRSGRLLNSTESVVNAVTHAQGVGIYRGQWASRDNDSGINESSEVVRPFDSEALPEISYYVVYPLEKSDNPVLATFINFLESEIQNRIGRVT